MFLQGKASKYYKSVLRNFMEEKNSMKEKIDIVKKSATLIVLIIILIIFSVFCQDFFSVSNFFLILRQVSILALVALGMTIVVIGGEIDLSLGAITIAGMALVMFLLQNNIGIFFSIAITMGFGCFLGMINGILISIFRFPSLITTLATRSLFIGVVYIFTRGVEIYKNIPPSFLLIGQGYIGPVPVLVIINLGIYFVFYLFLSRTKFSYHLYTIGFRLEVAKSVGVRTKKILLIPFIVAGGLATLAGIEMGSLIGMYSSSMTDVYLFESLTAVFIGTTMLREGEPHIVGTFFGTILIGIMNAGLNSLGFSIQVQKLATGFILFGAIVGRAILTKK